ncbi:MAG: glycine zipper 2TM domain-containing protein [Pseudomonadota bacterium]
MKRSVSAVAALLVLGVLSGCANVDRRTQGQIIGGATGAAVGSLFGSGSGRTLAVGAGAVAGSIIGGAVAERRN